MTMNTERESAWSTAREYSDVTPGQPHGVEMNLALIGMALFLTLAGPGRWAVAGDTERWLVERGWKGREKRQDAAERAAVAA
jgi:hypothetical protein